MLPRTSSRKLLLLEDTSLDGSTARRISSMPIDAPDPTVVPESTRSEIAFLERAKGFFLRVAEDDLGVYLLLRDHPRWGPPPHSAIGFGGVSPHPKTMHVLCDADLDGDYETSYEGDYGAGNTSGDAIRVEFDVGARATAHVDPTTTVGERNRLQQLFAPL